MAEQASRGQSCDGLLVFLEFQLMIYTPEVRRVEILEGIIVL